MTRYRHSGCAQQLRGRVALASQGGTQLLELYCGVLERLALPHRQRRYDPFLDNLADFMAAARSAGDWRVRAERVKDEHGGHYPDNWYVEVIASGIATPELLRFEVHRTEPAESQCRASA